MSKGGKLAGSIDFDRAEGLVDLCLIEGVHPTAAAGRREAGAAEPVGRP
jgi:hypothetical protein